MLMAYRLGDGTTGLKGPLPVSHFLDLFENRLTIFTHQVLCTRVLANFGRR